MSRHQAITATMAAALLLTITACGKDSDAPTMTRAQAKQQTVDYMGQALTDLPQPVATAGERENGTNCFKNDAPSEYDGQVVEVTERRVSGIPMDRQAEYVAHLRTRIESMGFQQDDSGALRTSAHFTNSANKFTGSIDGIGSSYGVLVIGFSSPCVWPDGTKPPP
ncbi:hypothetical protein ACFRMQ_08645 [Kitasatospora sp. NPDC056783]|uniref:hypothetical protein n=1 Tax=Kitasatospora sp. NPDC056783 TaxID=3345943 RepID=UPI00368D3379